MPATPLMKAERIHGFGGPEVLKFEDVPRPNPGRNEVLVRVHAAGVNPIDWKIRRGQLGELRLPLVLGWDFSGVVESIGKDVSEFRVGDEIFGEAAPGSGSYAEFALARTSQCARKPAALDHIHAAALPVVGSTAWQALFDIAGLRAGQTVLIHAAAGGVGSIAVQLARLKGARVIGTASSRNADFVRQLGADEVIDYRTGHFDDSVRGVDVVLDTVGGETQDRSWHVLKRGGILVSTVQLIPKDKPVAFGVRGAHITQHPRSDQLAEIAELVASGRITLNIDTVLPLDKARHAQELSESRHARGKIVLVVASAYAA